MSPCIRLLPGEYRQLLDDGSRFDLYSLSLPFSIPNCFRGSTSNCWTINHFLICTAYPYLSAYQTASRGVPAAGGRLITYCSVQLVLILQHIKLLPVGCQQLLFCKSLHSLHSFFERPVCVLRGTGNCRTRRDFYLLLRLHSPPTKLRGYQQLFVCRMISIDLADVV